MESYLIPILILVGIVFAAVVGVRMIAKEDPNDKPHRPPSKEDDGLDGA